MELQQFVGETIKAIFNGVRSAQDYAKTVDGKVVPDDLNAIATTPGLLWSGRGVIVEKLEFDVALTVTEGESKQGNAGITVWGIGASVKGQENSKNETVSRVKFSVPIVYPRQL